MIMGDTCTRGCHFCHVKTGHPQGYLDASEPDKVAFAIGQMGEDLRYIVITSVDRDDLPDQGAWHFNRTIRAIRLQHPSILIEILTPDFRGQLHLVDIVAQAKPDVFAHNIETVERLQKKVRDPRAGYQQSLSVLSHVKKNFPDMLTKTSIMLGLGEEDKEIEQTLKDLRSIDCDVVTFGQYLQPTAKHLKVEKFYTPEEFTHYQKLAESMGFLYVASGPLVRSSYRAGEYYLSAMIEQKRQVQKEMNHEFC